MVSGPVMSSVISLMPASLFWIAAGNAHLVDLSDAPREIGDAVHGLQNQRRLRLGSSEAHGDGLLSGVVAAADVQLGQNRRHVVIDRPRGYDKPPGNLRVP
jgi:hypothetical protein